MIKSLLETDIVFSAVSVFGRKSTLDGENYTNVFKATVSGTMVNREKFDLGDVKVKIYQVPWIYN